MLDMRYHIASLVAVFLALTLGIVLGTVFVDERVLVEKQNQLVEGIRKDVDQISLDNKKLSERIKLDDEFQQAVLPFVTQKKLDGKVIVILESVALPAPVKSSLIGVLEQAGAKVFFIKLTSASFGLERKEVQQRLASFFPEEKLKKEELKIKTINQLALSLLSAEPAFINELVGMELLEVDRSLSTPVNNILIAGGAEDNEYVELLKNDIAVGEQLKTMNIPVIGIETSESKTSSIPLFQKSTFTTVDNVDTVIGQAALILVLEGRQGNYGTKPTAQRLLPAIETVD